MPAAWEGERGGASLLLVLWPGGRRGSSVPASHQHRVSGGVRTCLPPALLVNTRTPRSLPGLLVSIISFHSIYTQPGLSHPRCRIWHIDLINFISLMVANAPIYPHPSARPFISQNTQQIFQIGIIIIPTGMLLFLHPEN